MEVNERDWMPLRSKVEETRSELGNKFSMTTKSRSKARNLALVELGGCCATLTTATIFTSSDGLPRSM